MLDLQQELERLKKEFKIITNNDDIIYKNISTFKKRIKYCKNPMMKKKLEQELNLMYKNKKKGRNKMNSKEVVAIEDMQICMKCLKKNASHTYKIHGRGYGSYFDDMDSKFQCCDECDKPEYNKWFNEKEVMVEYIETYQHEEKILELIKSLPLESQELFWNTFNFCNWAMDAQDWIDFKLDELPHKKCKEYYLYSPKDIEAYTQKFTTCEYVVNVY